MSIAFTAVEGGRMAVWLKSAPVNATLHMSGLPTSLSSGMTSMAFWKSFAACTCDEVRDWIPLLYTSQQLLGATRRIQAHCRPKHTQCHKTKARCAAGACVKRLVQTRIERAIGQHGGVI